jgi:hypothetical protein
VSATLDQRTIKRRAALLEQWCEELVQGYLHERRVELPRLERHAIEALDRSQERFPGEHRIARSVLDVDIPRKEKFLDAALLILQNADYKERALFILRPEERQLRAGRVLNAGGLVSDSGKWVNF